MNEDTQLQKVETNVQEMPFYSHFAELRSRMLKCIVAVFVGAIASFSFADWLYGFLAVPVKEALPESSQMIFISPVEPFFVYLKLSVLAGGGLTSPFVFFQIWRFIAPGLYAHEKKALIPLVFCSTVIFIVGAVFCYKGVLPLGLQVLISAGSTEAFSATAQISMSEYYTLVIRLIAAFGIVFEMPVFSYFLTKLGVITPQTLVRHWRIAVVIIFVMAALLTPPDILTQVLLGLPMCLLYAVSILVSKMASKPQSVSTP